MKTEVEFEQFFKSKLLGDLEELEIKRLNVDSRRFSTGSKKSEIYQVFQAMDYWKKLVIDTDF
jgi:hypothetical protein